ncbi:MAG: hypothetical protein WA173_01635 [Pseudomonas sp.]|uniref:hypothetical protein n=1 Tax=Pseudomonas sp. TaxID=306 RepID=UPI003BB7020D
MTDETSTKKLKALRSFQMKTVADMIEKLDWEIGMLVDMQNSIDLDTARKASYCAINAAISAWHVVDWCWVVASAEQRARWLANAPVHRAKQSPQSQFQRLLEDNCSALRLCKEVANAAKHLKPGQFTDHQVQTSGPVFVTVKASAGGLSSGEPIATHTAWLLIREDGGQQHTAKSVLDEANDFLWGFAADEGLLDLPGGE